jgi:hypothetical protein
MSKHEILTSEAHAELRVHTNRAAHLGDAVMSCMAIPSEFRQVQNEYPILFRLNAERDNFTALALFGFETGENLFLEGERWNGRYIPLAIAIQPFLIGSPDANGDRQVHIDLDSPRIAQSEGVRLFDQTGRPTPFLDAIAEKLGELDAGYRESPTFFAALRRHNLLEPMTLEVTLDDGSTNRLVGFHVIAEEQLQSLDEASLAELHREGHLMPIFMAIASLGNLSALIARKNARLSHG